MNLEQRQTTDRIVQHAQRQIWITFRKEGIHKYPAAAEDPRLADVSFLANEHRHIFHFRVSIDVFHNDRDIEFIQFKRWLENLFRAGHTGNNNTEDSVLSLDYKSCEMMADDLYVQIAAKYPDRVVWIEVAEDGESGALVKYETHRPHQSINI